MTLDPALEQDILAAVDAGFDDQLAFTMGLVRHPSTRGREHTVQDLVLEALRARGYALDRWVVDPDEIRHHPGFSPVAIDYANAVNVVATHHPAETTGRSLILNGHVDVVPAGPLDMWTRPPFEPGIEGDWLSGRGTGDMKAGVAAMIFALDALRRTGHAPAATVHLESVCEEEATGNGALAALLRGYRADAALIPEPTAGHIVRANLGVIWFRVRVRGHPVHVSDAGAGANAIEAAGRIAARLRTLEAELNAEKADWPPFDRHDHPINFNPGKIAGGDWPSSVPAWCDLDCRLAVYPGQDPADVARRIEAAVAEACRDDPFLSSSPATVDYTGFFARGYTLAEGTEAEATLAAAHEAVTGHPLQERLATAYLDARVFALYGDCPALTYGPLARNVHGFDEAVSLASVRETTRAIALFVARWCGLTKA